MITVRRLVWERATIDHIARHDVTPNEVEEVCHGSCIVLDARRGRFLIIGPTEKKRPLAVIVDPEPEEGVYYPVTARPADRRERRRYQEETGVTV